MVFRFIFLSPSRFAQRYRYIILIFYHNCFEEWANDAPTKCCLFRKFIILLYDVLLNTQSLSICNYNRAPILNEATIALSTHSIKAFLALLEDNTPKAAAMPTPTPVVVSTPVAVPTPMPANEETSFSTPTPTADEKTVIGNTTPNTAQSNATQPKKEWTPKYGVDKPKKSDDEKKKKSRWWLWLLIVAVVGGIGGFIALSGGDNDAKPSEDKMAISAANAEAVDLGLPSGTLWATYNVGATSPEEYGNYYAWGETTTKEVYSEDNCKTYGNQDVPEDIAGNKAYDAATANWGKDWRIPTKAQFDELIDNCTWTWTERNGVKGYEVTSKKNNNSIFFPAAGDRGGSYTVHLGLNSEYLSSTPYEADYAYCLISYNGVFETALFSRIFGLPVRPVKAKTANGVSVNNQEFAATEAMVAEEQIVNKQTAELEPQKPKEDISVKTTPKNEKQPNNEIWYTSSDGNIIEPNNIGLSVFGAQIVSNEYKNGKGVIRFDRDVTMLGDGAFLFCNTLTSIAIPNSVATIDVGAFVGLSNLEKFKGKFASQDGKCLIINGVLIDFATFGTTKYSIPSSVTTIGGGAFAYSGLSEITIPNSTTRIESDAFYSCYGLTSITIPNSVTTIERRAFSCCGNLKEFKGKFATKDGRCLIVNGVLVACAPAGIKDYTIPNGVTVIGEFAFAYSSLTSINIPTGVTTIEYCAFAYCDNLTSVAVPSSLTTWDDDAFSQCSNIQVLREYDPNIGTLNGHEWVDLGLSVKWATCNVGANEPEQYGNFYAWRETTTKSNYTKDNYKINGKSVSDISGNEQYDAATANWGKGWRMPTKTESDELMDNCTWTWTERNGINGYEVKSKKNSNSIFLPAAGCIGFDSKLIAGRDGSYWSSTPQGTDFAWTISFSDCVRLVGYFAHPGGLPVRPVVAE